MEKNKIEKIRKLGLICGIVMVIAGIIITIVSFIDRGEDDSWWRVISGVLFVAVGILYIYNNTLLKQ